MPTGTKWKVIWQCGLTPAESCAHPAATAPAASSTYVMHELHVHVSEHTLTQIKFQSQLDTIGPVRPPRRAAASSQWPPPAPGLIPCHPVIILWQKQQKTSRQSTAEPAQLGSAPGNSTARSGGASPPACSPSCAQTGHATRAGSVHQQRASRLPQPQLQAPRDRPVWELQGLSDGYAMLIAKENIDGHVTDVSTRERIRSAPWSRPIGERSRASSTPDPIWHLCAAAPKSCPHVLNKVSGQKKRQCGVRAKS